MRTDQDLERAVRLWVAQGSDRLPDPSLDAALNRIATTNQRHAGWLARRINLMNGNVLKYGLAAVAVVAAVILGVQFLPGSVGGPTEPTPTPTPVTLASGSFAADLGGWGQTIDIEATRTGDDVSGTLEVSGPEGDLSVDLQCSRTRDDGLLVIGGAVTESTNEVASEADYGAIVFADGTPARTLLYLDATPEDVGVSPADSCQAFLETMFSDPEFVGLTAEDLRPIQGDLELGS